MGDKPGLFIVFEGLDGSGQTTQAGLLKRWIEEKAGSYAYYTKEPTDGPFGAMLRLAISKRLSLAKEARPGKFNYAAIDEVTLALAFAADRADHLANEIEPKLDEGMAVICDRYYLSSLAYQSVGVDFAWLKDLNSQFRRPDITFFLDVPAEICKERMQRQRWHVELYESVDRLRAVMENFHVAIQDLVNEGEKVISVDGTQPVDKLHELIVETVKELGFASKFSPNGRELTAIEISSTSSLSVREIADLDMG